jgi:dephospho-CoA kinase
MLAVGLTGNYGMGKSTVLDMFGVLGAVTIDADEIVDGLLKDESVLESVRKAFGDDVFLKDGCLDRMRIASVVFRDKKMRNTLEGIIHPLVFEKIDQFLKEIEKKETEDKILVIEIPRMFETGRIERFHRTITVHADEGVVLRRLKEIGVSRDDAAIRLNAQMAIEEKISRADFAIDNSGDPDETRAQVKDIYDRLLLEMRRLATSQRAGVKDGYKRH